MTAAVRQGQVCRVQMARDLEVLAVVVSCAEANALRGVVTVCEVREDPDGRYRGLPTAIGIPAQALGVEKAMVAIASPYTIHKNCVVRDSVQGFLPPRVYEQLEEALKRVFGWVRWPE